MPYGQFEIFLQRFHMPNYDLFMKHTGMGYSRPILAKWCSKSLKAYQNEMFDCIKSPISDSVNI